MGLTIGILVISGIFTVAVMVFVGVLLYYATETAMEAIGF